MRRNLLLKMTASYIMVFFTIIFLLYMTFFLFIRDELEKDTHLIKNKYAEYVMQSIDFQLRAIDQSAINLIQNNETIKRLFEVNAFDPLLHVETYDSLNTLMVRHTLLDSVYVVRYADGKIISNRVSSHIAEYGDQLFINEMMVQAPKGWGSQRPFKEFVSSRSKDVVSLVRKYPLHTGELGVLVLNVDVLKLDSLIMELNKGTVSYLELYSTGMNRIIEKNHEESIVNHSISEVQSQYTGWVLRSGLRSQSTNEWLESIGSYWIVIGLVIVTAGALLLAALSIKHYHPVQTIVSRIQSYYTSTEQAHEQQIIGVGLLEKSFQEFIEVSEKYKAQANEVQQLSRLQFFRDVIEGTRQVKKTEWASAMHTYGMPGQFDQAYVQLIEIDQYSLFIKNYTVKDQELFRFVLHAAIVESAGSKPFLHAWAEWISPSRMAVIIRYTNTGVSNEPTKLLNEYRDWVDIHLPFPITVGIGDPSGEIEGLVASYTQAVEAASYKLVLGVGRTIAYRDLPIGEKNEMYEHLVRLRSAADLYKLGKEGWEPLLKQSFELFAQRWISIDELRNLLNYFIFYLYKELQKLPKEEAVACAEQLHEGLLNALNQEEQLEGILARWVMCLTATQELLKEHLHHIQHYELITNVRTYIEQNYADAEISLVTLSDIFGISPKYLSQVFKETYGEKFIDVLLALRMEHAKVLLKESSVSIQEISGMVGYTNAVSFSQSFKKYAGISPSYYRGNI